jgi:AcrR family transcriptional regulator
VARRSTPVTDAARLLALLWHPPEPGSSGLSVAAITDAAIGIADAAGLAAVTMRRVAAELGAATMTLYAHVPGKAELIELMTDRVAGQLYADGDLPANQADWKAGMRHIAECNWSHYLRHRWTAEVLPGRPVLGPGVTGKYDAELAPLDGIGLSDVQMDVVLGTLLGIVESSARWQIGLERVRSESGVGDARWWEQMAPLLAQAMQGHELPLAARVGTAAGEQHQSAGEPRSQMHFGVEQLIQGVERLTR